MGKRKLVPLMPILESLDACAPARAWVAKTNHTTFREAYNACHAAHWLDYLVCVVGLTEPLRRSNPSAFDAWVRAATPDAVRRVFPAHVVERALYDYAVREGLA